MFPRTLLKSYEDFLTAYSRREKLMRKAQKKRKRVKAHKAYLRVERAYKEVTRTSKAAEVGNTIYKLFHAIGNGQKN